MNASVAGGAGARDVPLLEPGAHGSNETDALELRHADSRSSTFMDEDDDDDHRDGMHRHQNMVCKQVLCCCLARRDYLRCRRGTWDTLSRNASKFGRPTRFLPSRVFEVRRARHIVSRAVYRSLRDCALSAWV